MPLQPEQVHQRLREAARRLRWLRSLRHLLSGLAVGLAVLVLLLVADSQFHFGSAARWIAFLFIAGPLLGGLLLGLRSALPGVSESSIARRVEEASEHSRNTLISAVQFDRELPASSAFRKAIFQEMDDPFPRVNWALVFDLDLFKRLAAALGCGLLLLGTYAAIRPHYFTNSVARILLPGRPIPPLTRTQIAELTPGDTRIINGRDLRITVRLEGEMPKGVWIYSREPGGSWQKALMDREIGSATFTCDRKALRDPLSYQIVAGDATTRVYQVAVRPRTALVRRSAEITPPEYTRLSPETRRDFAALQGINPGSRVALTLEFNHSLDQLQCNNSEIALQKTGDATWSATGVIKTNTTLQLQMRDSDGLTDSETVQIGITPDEPPRLIVTAPPEGRELFATPDDALPITFQATDNFGLESVALYRTTDENQQAEQIAQWKEAAGKKSFAATLKVPLAKYARDNRVTLALAARDQNNVSGPGITWSRPLIVTLRSQEQVKKQETDAAQKSFSDLEALVKLQASNLEQTQSALGSVRNATGSKPSLRSLLDRQSQIAESARLLLSGGSLSPEAQTELTALAAKEIPAAIVALRNAAGASDSTRQITALAEAAPLETVILARLQGLVKAAARDALKAKIQDLISGVEELSRRQRELLRATLQAQPAEAVSLSERQDALSTKAAEVRKNLEKGAHDRASGDQDFRDRLAKAATMFREMAIPEQMLAAAEQLQNKAFPAAAATEKEVITHLGKIIELLNQWQLAAAQRDAEALKKEAREMAEKLEKLAEIQKGVVEKSKEIARKGEARPEDIAAAEAMKKAKEQIAETVEQMLTDAHVFPDLKPSNELRGELTQIYEDVIQQDKEDAAAGNLKANEVLVQKEDGLLQAIEQAKKVAEDLEMWLPNKNDTTKWLLENFDKTEMPDIPNLPLPDAFEDLVGDLLEEQKGLAEEAQDAASNQALAQAQQGWGVADGPMPGFSAQGKSGNTRPNKNEQTGRSSGGREGMSNGEMVGDTASTLEGTTPNARRTNDPMQQGHVKDDGGIQQARATGGGKAGGFSDRNGMEGNAPLRPSGAPRMGASDALAVQQALLSEKTARTYAQASLLYLRARGLPGVTQLMDESQAALKEGRMEDFRNLHQRIVTKLTEVKGGIQPGNVVNLASGDRSRTQEKAVLGGDEGQAPPAYQKAVVDYYRSLQNEK